MLLAHYPFERRCGGASHLSPFSCLLVPHDLTARFLLLVQESMIVCPGEGAGLASSRTALTGTMSSGLVTSSGVVLSQTRL
jgi:hypothetical protein